MDEIHAKQPLDAILVTGDLTDAGRSAEWAEFFDAFAPHPQLAGLLIGFPGNHDVNVVDRANPARLDLPTSPKKRLRQVRTVSALAAIQGARVKVLDRISGRLGGTLGPTLEPHLAFADEGIDTLTGGPQKLDCGGLSWHAVLARAIQRSQFREAPLRRISICR